MGSDRIRALLESSGYEIRYREHEWVECLLAGDGESFVGRGTTRETALAAAVHAAFPTRLSQAVLEQAAGGALATASADGARGHAPAETAPARPSNRRPKTPPPRSPSSSGLPSVMVRAPTPTPRAHSATSAPRPEDRRTPGQIAVIVSRPPPPRQSSGSYAVPPVTDHDAPVPVDANEALEELDILMDRVRDSREELGLCAPDRQRLAMLAWICLGRAQTDRFPDDLRVRDRVSAISRQLTDIGKTFWPGSVTALQLHMQPRDLPRHLLGGVATTWRRAAELAEQALRDKEHEDERRGFDQYGWSDAKMTFPRPADPARMLDDLIREVEAISGPLELQAAPADTSARPDAAVFQRWVRTYRWLRCCDIDPDRWARLGGRFRWWAFRREPTLHPAGRELEPGYVPAYPWATLLGQDPEKRRRERQLRHALSAGPSSDRSAVIDWLSAALPFGDTHHPNIVKMLVEHKDLVLELSGDDLPEADRRARRRLGKVQDDLQNGVDKLELVPLPDEPPDDVVDVASAAQNASNHIPAGLLDRVRPVTRGKRSVYVSRRRDPDLQARLQEVFAFEKLDCRIAESRRVQQLGEAIADDEYDLVLGATGFQSHTLDTVLARACRQAGVQYIRVNHGLPVACLRAVARDFGC